MMIRPGQEICRHLSYVMPGNSPCQFNEFYFPSNGPEALSISLINDEIEFLNQKIFSLQERFGSDTGHLEKRVKELRAELQLLFDLLKTVHEDQLIKIHCEIDMKISEPEAVHN